MGVEDGGGSGRGLTLLPAFPMAEVAEGGIDKGVAVTSLDKAVAKRVMKLEQE